MSSTTLKKKNKLYLALFILKINKLINKLINKYIQ